MGETNREQWGEPIENNGGKQQRTMGETNREQWGKTIENNGENNREQQGKQWALSNIFQSFILFRKLRKKMLYRNFFRDNTYNFTICHKIKCMEKDSLKIQGNI